MFIELVEVVLEIMLTLISPEKTAEKVKDADTSKSAKKMLVVLFTSIYGISLIGILLSFILIQDIIYKAFAVLLIIFLIYCLYIFYNRIIKDK